ncbi:MAG: hypothetical protein ABW321_30490 [Polyangiales bacterium]
MLIVDDEAQDGAVIAAAPGGMPITTRRKHWSFLTSFPLLAISLLLYAGCNLTREEGHRPWYRAEAFSISHMSGDIWHITTGDVFLSFSMMLLYVEILKSTRIGGESLVNHAFSALVFVGALMLFLSRPGYGNSVFFIFLAMTALDFMAGFIITAISARRDTSYGGFGGLH